MTELEKLKRELEKIEPIKAISHVGKKENTKNRELEKIKRIREKKRELEKIKRELEQIEPVRAISHVRKKKEK